VSLDPEKIKAARAHLAAADPALARADAATPDFPWRTRDGGYPGLMRIVVGQQVSVTAANAIWERLDAGVGGVSAENILKHDIDSLKGFGLSRPKARYALAVAESERDGAIDFAGLPALDDEAAIAALTQLTGIGRWTAEVYLTFCEGRLDFFPAGDVALQEGLRLADLAERRLTEKALYARAEAWRPHRGVAAHLLWAYYGGVKRGEIGAALPI
jgi:DNA-3-methyladenine glycosylase II